MDTSSLGLFDQCSKTIVETSGWSWSSKATADCSTYSVRTKLTPMIRVPIDELTFGWEHKKPPHPGGKCVIKHNGRVVKRGSYDDMIELFDSIVHDNEEDTVAVEYEQKPKQPESEPKDTMGVSEGDAQRVESTDVIQAKVEGC